MSGDTKIEWAHRVWNPVRGCSRVSKGCESCYAERMAHRFSGKGKPYEGLTVLTSDGPRWTGKIKLVKEAIEEPTKWKKPQRIFVNSMSDLFHKDVPFDFIYQIFETMMVCEEHSFLILTKRPERMAKVVKEVYEKMAIFYRKDLLPLKNVWLGVSCEDQKTANDRIPLLLDTPAVIRWISAEPLLGPIDLTNIIYDRLVAIDALKGLSGVPIPHQEIGAKLDWVVTGGESGHGARPMHPDWARSLRNQCVKAGTKFFFKQHGDWIGVDQLDSILAPGVTVPSNTKEFTFDDGTICMKLGKKFNGRLLDNVEWNEFPATLKGA